MLTAAQLRDARPRARRYELSCDALPGFIVRVLPTGRKVFFARYRDAAGRDIRHRLGPMTPTFGIEQARRAALEVLARAGDAVAPTDRGRPRADRAATAAHACPTVREFAARFLADHVRVRLRRSTAWHYCEYVERHIVPALGDKRLDEVTPADVQRLHNSLRDTPSRANYVRCVLSVLFSKAEQWELTTARNPVTRVGKFTERAVERFLSPDERQRLEAVLRACSGRRSRQRGAISRDAAWAIRLLALTGMRRDEILDLTWPQVDWRRCLLRLPDSKTGKRDVIVSDAVIALLRDIHEAKGHPGAGNVICNPRGRKLTTLNATWLKVRALAGLDDVRLHDLRHSVASDAIMNGVPLEVVGKMLGHRNYTTTQRYAHIADSALRDAVNRTSQTIVRAALSGGEQ